LSYFSTLFNRFAEQTLRDCREELLSKTEELKSVLESSTIAEKELREEAKLRKRYKQKLFKLISKSYLYDLVKAQQNTV